MSEEENAKLSQGLSGESLQNLWGVVSRLDPVQKEKFWAGWEAAIARRSPGINVSGFRHTIEWTLGIRPAHAETREE